METLTDLTTDQIKAAIDTANKVIETHQQSIKNFSEELVKREGMYDYIGKLFLNHSIVNYYMFIQDIKQVNGNVEVTKWHLTLGGAYAHFLSAVPTRYKRFQDFLNTLLDHYEEVSKEEALKIIEVINKIKTIL